MALVTALDGLVSTAHSITQSPCRQFTTKAIFSLFLFQFFPSSAVSTVPMTGKYRLQRPFAVDPFVVGRSDTDRNWRATDMYLYAELCHERPLRNIIHNHKLRSHGLTMPRAGAGAPLFPDRRLQLFAVQVNGVWHREQNAYTRASNANPRSLLLPPYPLAFSIQHSLRNKINMIPFLVLGVVLVAHALPLNSPLLASYDYIIVGGGPGGLTVANRLSEDPSVNVLLLEAGPADHGEPAITVPGYIGQAIGGQYDWNLMTEPQTFLDGRARDLPQGRALGGGSVINGMLWNRGGQLDYQDWVSLGNPGWSWSDMLPYFKKVS
nr:putative gmc-type oxidoreductase [Quercus suber]